ncbi:hypothetical protein GGX14DRAFT_386857 [Mycena pura]|uniref:Uncharacterized protein n=1 Tax=Mycena pura TaxID=153505 RepID=A0AAD6YMG8_9AGAR|nr:hypothetical protein GGX14DRAFT_386857 [Mycena pura]
MALLNGHAHANGDVGAASDDGEEKLAKHRRKKVKAAGAGSQAPAPTPCAGLRRCWTSCRTRPRMGTQAQGGWLHISDARMDRCGAVQVLAIVTLEVNFALRHAAAAQRAARGGGGRAEQMRVGGRATQTQKGAARQRGGGGEGS